LNLAQRNGKALGISTAFDLPIRWNGQTVVRFALRSPILDSDEVRLMFDTAYDGWPDQLPELGAWLLSNTSNVMKRWEEMVGLELPFPERTAHRSQLRNNLPEYLKALAKDLQTGRQGRDAKATPAARQHGMQRWQLGWDLELVVRDYQLLLHAIIDEANQMMDRNVTTTEMQNLTRLLQDANIEAIRGYYAFRQKIERNDQELTGHFGLLDNCSDAVIELDLDGTILYWNKGAERMYGYRAQDIVGTHVAIIFPPNRRLEFDRCIMMLKNGREVPPFDTIRRRADGTDISVSITASPIRDKQNNLQGYVSIARDISDRVRAAEALRDALEEAERASRAKSEFLANVSHELRTPMNAIIGMTDLALDEELSPELRDYLETTRESADLLLSLVNDVLDISKLESGKFVLDEVNFGLRELIADSMRSISSRAYRKGLEIACKVANNVPDNLHGDPLRLRQILTNLVGNAIKFTDEGEIIIEVTQETGSGKSCVLRFAVRDTGIGISEEDQKRVFAPFTQADASTTRRFAGTGLGLAIASHLINCFRGQFWVESEVGVGSTFFFTARFALAEQSKSTTNLPAPAVEKLRDLSVLIADDNETSREILAKLLADWQMKPVVTADAKTALEQWQSAQTHGEPFRLAVIDAIMPERDGFQLIEEIKSKDELGTKTILMLSSTDRLAFKERCQEVEFDEVLEKPISQSNLFDAIVSALGVSTLDVVRNSDFSKLPPAKRTLNILLAEDTPANRKVAERVLAKRGHHVISAANGREAVDLFHQNAFDVILMDVQMPSMDGFQATEAIRSYEEEHSSARRIPIIAMTAHAMVGDRHRCLAAGMDDYISKPISIRRLVEIVEAYGQEGIEIAEPIQADASDREVAKALIKTVNNTGALMDLENALRRLDGDQSLLIDLIGFYLEDYPGLLTKMDEASEAEDAASLERAAHSLKGLVANFDAMYARDLAQRMEFAAKERDLTTASGLISNLKTAASDLATELENYRNSLSS
jgi:two-component system, sensor histidine kinase and response regulator